MKRYSGSSSASSVGSWDIPVSGWSVSIPMASPLDTRFTHPPEKGPSLFNCEGHGVSPVSPVDDFDFFASLLEVLYIFEIFVQVREVEFHGYFLQHPEKKRTF